MASKPWVMGRRADQSIQIAAKLRPHFSGPCCRPFAPESSSTYSCRLCAHDLADVFYCCLCRQS